MNELFALYQALFERLLMENPGSAVISTQPGNSRPTEASWAGETQVLRYLYQCYERCVNIQNTQKVKKLKRK